MEKTFHKEFVISDSTFTQTVPLDKLPQYGWKTTPVTLEITYDETNTVKMKTEIHEEGQEQPEIIISHDD